MTKWQVGRLHAGRDLEAYAVMTDLVESAGAVRAVERDDLGRIRG
jgi:hypothetical protein